MKNGFRVSAQATKKDRLRSMEAEIKNTQMASNISQMMIKQLLNNIQNIGQDLNSAIGQLSELQYQMLAVRKHFNLDPKELALLANEQRLKDFEEAASKQDLQEGLLDTDVVDADSVVVLTSSVNGDADKGVFRSRLKLSETQAPQLVDALIGKRVGDVVTVKLNEDEHTITLLGVKKSPVEEANIVEAAASEVVAN